MTLAMTIQTWEKHVPKRRRNRPQPSTFHRRPDRFGRRHWIGTVDGMFVMETEFDPGYPEHCARLYTTDLTLAQQRADDHIRTMEEEAPHRPDDR